MERKGQRPVSLENPKTRLKAMVLLSVFGVANFLTMLTPHQEVRAQVTSDGCDPTTEFCSYLPLISKAE